MAGIIVLGVIGASVYAVAKNQQSVFSRVLQNREDTAGGVSYGGFHFTRSPKSDLFSDLDSLQLDPSMPIGGRGGKLPFIAIQEKDGIFGIKKLLLQTPNNTLYTVYQGTMERLDV